MNTIARKPRLKNATSTSRNIFEAIQKTLATHKAQHITFEYESDGSGKVHAIDFTIDIHGIARPFRLPARVANVEAILFPGRRTLTDSQKEQAYRTAWANIRDWIAAQMALIDTGMVKVEEVFLPYMLDSQGRTFFQVMTEHQFLLESGEEK